MSRFCLLVEHWEGFAPVAYATVLFSNDPFEIECELLKLLIVKGLFLWFLQASLSIPAKVHPLYFPRRPTLNQCFKVAVPVWPPWVEVVVILSHLVNCTGYTLQYLVLVSSSGITFLCAFVQLEDSPV